MYIIYISTLIYHIIEKLIRISEEEHREYDERFAWYDRIYYRVSLESSTQFKHFIKAFPWYRL